MCFWYTGRISILPIYPKKIPIFYPRSSTENTPIFYSAIADTSPHWHASACNKVVTVLDWISIAKVKEKILLGRRLCLISFCLSGHF